MGRRDDEVRVDPRPALGHHALVASSGYNRHELALVELTEGRVVKGVRFQDLRDAGDPAELAAAYDREGADEVVFLDITASSDARKILLGAVERTADQVFIPLAVGGGVRSVEDMGELLTHGADKVSVNTAALHDPQLIARCAEVFGSQCVVLAIDARRRSDGSGWEVFSHGGRRVTGRDAVEWAALGEKMGAGEILLTSMDTDGTHAGHDLELTRAVRCTTYSRREVRTRLWPRPFFTSASFRYPKSSGSWPAWAWR